MRNLVLILFLLFYAETGVAQSVSSPAEFLNVALRKYPAIRKFDWKIHSYDGHETGYRHMQAYSAILDTVYVVTFDELIDIEKRVVYRIELTKSYTANGEMHRVVFDPEMNILFWYRISEPSGIYIFIRGRYYYEYCCIRTTPWTPGQEAFLEAHRDSLRKVPGDKLPPLPAIR